MHGIVALLLGLGLVVPPSPPAAGPSGQEPMAAARSVSGALEVRARRVGGALEVRLVLHGALPRTISDALPSGAQVNVVYPVQVRRRRAVIWDPKIWEGRVVSTVRFDPVTGRYRCELLLNDVIMKARETADPGVALAWLRSPPPIRLLLPGTRHALRLKCRAVFSTGTTWLVFPTSRGTDWVTVAIEGEQ
jgi:hypothetical protein